MMSVKVEPALMKVNWRSEYWALTNRFWVRMPV
jgi:hypothetical protein